MTNPIPNFGIPDTRPGYAFQSPGLGGAIGGGLEAVLQALLQGSQISQRQQQLDQTGQYYQGILAEQQANRQAEADKLAGQQRNARDMGGALQALMGGGGGVGQVAAGLRPELVPEFAKQAEPIVKRQSEEAEKKRQEGMQTAFLNSLPNEARPAGVALIAARQMGLDDASGRQMFGAVWSEAASPDMLALITKQHPEWSRLPVPEQVKLYVDEQMERTEVRFRRPEKPTPDTPDRMTEGERKAGALYKTAKFGYDTLEKVLDLGKGVPGWSAQQLAKAGYGTGNVMTSGEFRRMRQAARVLSDSWLRYTSGAAVPEPEVERFAQGFLPEAGDDPDTLRQKKEARRVLIDALRDGAGRGAPPRYPENPY